MPIDLRLKVMASTIDGKGVVKLDSESYRLLKLGEGIPVTVTYGAKSLDLAAKMDTWFSPSTARMMKADMADLRVEEGMEVTVARKNGDSTQAEKPPKKGKSDRKGKKPKAASLDRF